MDQPVKVVVIKRREPFEVAVLALLLISAVTQLLVKSPPGSISALIPGWYAKDWSALTILGSGVALFGIWTPATVSGLFLERLGITVATSALVIYGSALTVVGGVRSLGAAGLILAISYAFWVRRREITQTINSISEDPVQARKVRTKMNNLIQRLLRR